jgi:hypothetical protein
MGGSIFAYGIQQVSACLAPIPNPGMPPSHQTFTPLPAGWGVDRFPCTRVGAIDCFKEGAFDYPAALNKVS